MRRRLGAWLLVAACAALAPRAQAQSIKLGINEIRSSAGTRDGNDALFAIDKAECQDPAAVVDINIRSIPSAKQFLDFWKGTDCNSADKRNTTTSTACANLANLSTQIANRTQIDNLELSVAELFGGACDGSADGKPTIYVLATTTKNSTEDVGGDYGTIQIQLDTTPPNPPQNVQGNSGEASQKVTWDTPENATNDIRGYRVYVERGVEADSQGGCVATKLVAGGAAPTDIESDSVQNLATNSFFVTDLEVGQRAAVAVTAYDNAGQRGNESVLSNVSCIEAVPTDGFWDVYQGAPYNGDAKTGCALQTGSPGTGATRTTHLWMGVLLVAMAIMLRRLRLRRQIRCAALQRVHVLGISRKVGLGVTTLLACAFASSARAETWYDKPGVSSSEFLIVELHGGPYTPNVGNGAFDAVFDDVGPLLKVEVDLVPFFIPYVGPVGAGLSAGWAHYKAKAFEPGQRDQRVAEDTTLRLFPLSALAVLRVDTLARELGVPFVFTGKAGVDVTPWRTSTGGNTDASGLTESLHLAGKLSFVLDFIDRHAARTLDEDWGVNHTEVFFELLYTKDIGSSLPLNDTTWTAGLAFVL